MITHILRRNRQERQETAKIIMGSWRLGFIAWENSVVKSGTMAAMIESANQAYMLPPEEKIEPVYDALARYYGELEWRPSIDPLSELVLTILSQHTSDTNRDRAFRAMKEQFPTWEEVRDAPTEELADSIRSGGLANQKAPRIQSALRLIGEERGELDLSFLMEMPPAEAKAWLSSFNGVGPKTAACVLMFSCGMPVLPVDTHVYRVSQRLGLIGEKTNADKAHDELEEIVPPNKRYTFHINMITHGRKICKAQRPLCEACVLHEWCSYYNRLILPLKEQAGY